MHAVTTPWYLRAWGPDVVGLPRDVWILWWGNLANRMGAFVVPFFALFLGSRGFSPASISTIAAAYGAGVFAATIIGGALADRLGRKRTILMSVWLGAASMLWLGAAESEREFQLAAAITGLTSDAYRPAIMAWAQDLVTPAQRRVVSALFYWGINAGFAAASVIGAMAVRYGYQTLVAADAATMVLFGLVVFVMLREPSSAGRGHVKATHEASLAEPQPFTTPAWNPLLWGFLPLSFLFGLAMWQNALALPLDMKARGFSDGEYGVLSALNGLFVIVLQPGLSRVFHLFSLRAILVAGTIAFGVGLGGYAVAQSIAAYALAIFIWSVGEIAALPASSTFIMNIAPASMRGRYQGLFTASWGLSQCIAPLIGATLFLHVGTSLWFVVALVMMGCAIGYYLLVPRAMR